MMLGNSRGVTLMEIMITLSLFTVFLLLSGTLVRKASRVLRFSEGKVSSIRAATEALDVIARDVRGAQILSSPKTGSSAVLEFSIVDSGNNARLFPTVVPPRFPMLVLNRASNLQTVRYALLGKELQRRTKVQGQSASTTTIAQGISAVEFTRKDNNSLLIRLEVEEERGTKPVSFVVPLLEGLP